MKRFGVLRSIQDLSRNFKLLLGNFFRLRLRKEMGYIVIPLRGSLPEFVPSPPGWYRYLPLLKIKPPHRPMSLSRLRGLFERIAADPRPPGVILRLDDLSAGWATAQSIRQMVDAFKESGKQVVTYSGSGFDSSSYFVACAADHILAAPGAVWGVMGLRTEVAFLKDLLDQIGIEVDVVAVSPYKTAGDMFSRATMSAEHREMIEGLLETTYQELTTAIAHSRSLEEDAVRELIDQAPLMSASANKAGLLDAVIFEDEIPAYLAGRSKTKPAKVATFEKAAKSLVRPVRWRSGKWIGVVSIRGLIVPGNEDAPSLPLPIPVVGGVRAAADPIIQRLRRVEQDDRFAALILHVDSRGGSAGAADLIWREVERIRSKKPVVALMGNVAASGGYYVAAAGNWIIAQPLSVTGSIGVVMMKFATANLFSRLKIHREIVQRGKNAGLFSDAQPFDERSAALMADFTNQVYHLFLDRVSASRGISSERLVHVAGGKIWMGSQAREVKLIDELGGFEKAVEKARELAHLPEDKWTPVVWVWGKGGNRLPMPYPNDPDGANWLSIGKAFQKEKTWLLMPYQIEIM